MKKIITTTSTFIIILLLLAGCRVAQDKTVSMLLPGSGGEISGDVKPGDSITTECSFTPDSTGFWLFNMLMSGDGGGQTIEVLDSDGVSISANSEFKTVFLEAGDPLIVKAYMFAYHAGSGASYTLLVSPAEEIPGGGGDKRVSGKTSFSFTPDRSGQWTFSTSDNGECTPYLLVRDSDNHGDFVHYARGESYGSEGAAENNVLMTLELREGAPYMVEAGFYLNKPGGFTLTVSPGE